METAPATIEKKEGQTKETLRGRLSSMNRLVGAAVLSAATLGGSPDAHADRRGDLIGGIVGGAIVGAVVMHAIESKSSGMEVSIDEGTLMALTKVGVKYNAGQKALFYGNQKMALESGRRKDKSVTIQMLTPNQFMITYIYEDNGGTYRQKCLGSVESNSLLVGTATPVRIS